LIRYIKKTHHLKEDKFTPKDECDHEWENRGLIENKTIYKCFWCGSEEYREVNITHNKKYPKGHDFHNRRISDVDSSNENIDQYFRDEYKEWRKNNGSTAYYDGWSHFLKI